MKEPKIRFKGFSGEWKECTLSNIITVNSGKDYKHLEKGTIPVYGTGGYMLSVNTSLSEHDAIGIGRKGTIDKPQYLNAPFWTVDTLFFLTTNNGDNLDFLFNLSQNIRWQKYDESTGVPSLSKNNIDKIKTCIPNKFEQQSVASFFTSLDAQISASTTRLASLKQMKAASLQAMFHGIIKASENGRFDNSNSDKSGYKVVMVGDIAYNSMRMWQGASGYSPYEGIVSPAYTVIIPQEGIHSSFFAYLFKNESIIKTFRLHSQGLTSDTWNLKFPAFSKIEVLFPMNIDEQKQIASFFTSLDRQIALHTQRLEKLKQIKAACLDKMFV